MASAKFPVNWEVRVTLRVILFIRRGYKYLVSTRSLRKYLFWKLLRLNIRNQLKRILVIDLLQNFIRQFKSIHSPERMVSFVIREIFICRLKHTKVGFIFFWH